MTSDVDVRDLTRRRWLVLLCSCLVNLCIGSLYAWSVFATPMAEHISELAGHEVAGLAIVFTVANAVGPITMISGGAVTRRLGARLVVLLGGVLFALGMVASGFATSLPMLVCTYGLGVGLGVGMAYGVTVSNSVRFFPDKGGLAGGLATASYGISSVIMPPFANAAISSLGVTGAFKVLGIVMLAVIALASTQVVSCPDGFAPEGWDPPVRDGSALAGRDRDWRQMLSDPAFPPMIGMLLCGAFSGLMVTSQASPLAQGLMGMGPAAAAVVVSLLALANATGRIVAGVVSDRIGPVATLRIVFVLLLAAMGSLLLCGAVQPLFFVGICLVGLCFGSVMGVYPGFTTSQFGARNNGVNYGIMFCGFALAGFLGPMAMGTFLSVLGSYAPAFVAASLLSVVGFVLTFSKAIMAK